MERIRLKDLEKEIEDRFKDEEMILSSIKGKENKEAYLSPVCTGLIKECYEKGLEEKEFEVLKKKICVFYRKNIF